MRSVPHLTDISLSRYQPGRQATSKAEISARDIEQWLIAEGRLLNDPVLLLEQFAAKLQSLGIPIKRIRIAQRVANPLIAAWGMIWNRSGETSTYRVTFDLFETTTWIGSPFQIVTQEKRTVRKKLTDLNENDHGAYHDLKNEGCTDFLVMPNHYGDGSVQGMSFATDAEAGFSDDHVETLIGFAPAIGAAFEPISMRHSMQSLLETYIGFGPARAVLDGALRRGDRRDIDAVVMLADMRAFTKASEELGRTAMLDKLERFFAAIGTAVHNHKGDVLKFLGDGVLAVFPVDPDNPSKACNHALAAVAEMIKALQDHRDIDYVVTLSRGELTYGNIGSPDRLDFTVIGPAVNLASRLEFLAKEHGVCCLLTKPVAECSMVPVKPLGLFDIRGVSGQQELFALDVDQMLDDSSDEHSAQI